MIMGFKNRKLVKFFKATVYLIEMEFLLDE